MYNEYPKELHNNLNAPGIYRRKVNVKVYLKDGSVGEMDSSYIVDPDFEIIFEPMVANGEHQSTPVDEEKIEMISYYGIQQIHDENLPQISYIASHIPKKHHKQFFERSPSDIVRPYFLDLGEEDNQKRLYRVKNIIKEQESISDEIALNLGIIVLFAPRHNAQEVTAEVVELYCLIAHQLSRKMELTLFSVICAMIDAYFDDENQYDEMVDIMKKNTSDETVERFVTFDIYEEKIADLEKVNSDLKSENERLKLQLKNAK